MPIVLGLVLTGALRLANGRERGPRVAGAAVALSFLVAYWLIVGLPPLPPVQSKDKFAYIVVGGMVLGFLFDFWRFPALFRWVAFAAGTGATLYWFGIRRFPTADSWYLLGACALWVASLIALWRVEAGRNDGLNPAVKLLIAALGTGVIAELSGSSASIAQLAFALATALGGFMLWNWPVHRYPHGAALLLGVGGALAGIVFWLVLFTKTNPIPLAILLLVFFADLAANRVRSGDGPVGRALKPIVLGIACLIPAAAAIGIAYMLADTEPSVY